MTRGISRTAHDGRRNSPLGRMRRQELADARRITRSSGGSDYLDPLAVGRWHTLYSERQQAFVRVRTVYADTDIAVFVPENKAFVITLDAGYAHHATVAGMSAMDKAMWGKAAMLAEYHRVMAARLERSA